MKTIQYDCLPKSISVVVCGRESLISRSTVELSINTAGNCIHPTSQQAGVRRSTLHIYQKHRLASHMNWIFLGIRVNGLGRRSEEQGIGGDSYIVVIHARLSFKTTQGKVPLKNLGYFVRCGPSGDGMSVHQVIN